MWMSGHPGNRRQWKAEMMTAATHLACVARSQSMGNGIPGLQKRKKRIMKMVLFYTLHTTKRRRNMKKQGFGTTKDGKEALLYTLSNKNGMEISVTDYGAHLVSVLVPDKDGKKRDVVLGFDSVTGYETDGSHFGATIGRNGNRIAGAAFELHGKTYQLAKNENNNNLHSGPDGYDYRLWDVEEADDSAVTFVLMSPDGDQGFPGNFEVSVTYTLTDENAVEIHYEGSCDQDTVVNMTNHSYFNLNGEGDILGQKLRIYASNYLEGNNQTCPTGAILPVANTPMDFTEGKLIGRDIDTGFAQTTMVGGGYDHCFVIDRGRGASQSLCAWASSDKTGISMKVYTTQPGVQLYTANFLQDCPSPGKGGVPMQKYGGFALETQHFPCSPSHPEFPTTVLRAGKVFRATTTLRFFTGKQCGKL